MMQGSQKAWPQRSTKGLRPAAAFFCSAAALLLPPFLSLLALPGASRTALLLLLLGPAPPVSELVPSKGAEGLPSPASECSSSADPEAAAARRVTPADRKLLDAADASKTEADG